MQTGPHHADFHKSPQDCVGSAPEHSPESPGALLGGPRKDAAFAYPVALLSRRRWYIRGFFAILLVVLATLLRLSLDDEFELHLHYLTYFPTVFLVASLFGTARRIQRAP